MVGSNARLSYLWSLGSFFLLGVSGEVCYAFLEAKGSFTFYQRNQGRKYQALKQKYLRLQLDFRFVR